MIFVIIIIIILFSEIPNGDVPGLFISIGITFFCSSPFEQHAAQQAPGSVPLL